MSKQQEIDPSIFQYDEVYEQIKALKKSKQIEKPNKDKQKDKEQPREGSKYIGKMKAVVEKRQLAHKRAKAKQQERMNEKLGIGQEEVFVTESYMKKKLEEEQFRKKELAEDQHDRKNSALDNTKGRDKMNDFRRKLLDQS